MTRARAGKLSLRPVIQVTVLMKSHKYWPLVPHLLKVEFLKITFLSFRIDLDLQESCKDGIESSSIPPNTQYECITKLLTSFYRCFYNLRKQWFMNLSQSVRLLNLNTPEVC